MIGTPGRLEDLANEGALDLSGVRIAVLDEADRMLDLGFEPAVRALLRRTSAAERHTAMFSATWPPAVEAVARAFLRSPVTVRVGRPRETDAPEANKRVKQLVEVCEPRDKDRRLEALLKEYHSSRTNRVLVFALYKKEAARIERQLQARGWHCCAIHGDLSQPARTAALTAFRSGSCPLLIATDVAARGLDVPDVDVVLNYTFPLTIEDYVHRIGRTARAGRTGTAYTLFTKEDKVRGREDRWLEYELTLLGSFWRTRECPASCRYGGACCSSGVRDEHQEEGAPALRQPLQPRRAPGKGQSRKV